MVDRGPVREPDALSAAGFAELYDRLRGNTGWGAQDRRGALNHIDPAGVAAAARSVLKGQTVSLAAPVEHEPAADNPRPCAHELSLPPAQPWRVVARLPATPAPHLSCS